MENSKIYHFSAQIYQTGINWCVDVPYELSSKLIRDRGRIHIKGKINNYSFHKTLIPVKNSPHRLFVNKEMMKGGKTAPGEIALFEIQQDFNRKIKQYPIPDLLKESLQVNKLSEKFEQLTNSKKRAILKYLSYLKREESLVLNINKLIAQLQKGEKNVRVP